jgi:hypothetical protein
VHFWLYFPGKSWISDCQLLTFLEFSCAFQE